MIVFDDHRNQFVITGQQITKMAVSPFFRAVVSSAQYAYK